MITQSELSDLRAKSETAEVVCKTAALGCPGPAATKYLEGEYWEFALAANPATVKRLVLAIEKLRAGLEFYSDDEILNPGVPRNKAAIVLAEVFWEDK